MSGPYLCSANTLLNAAPCLWSALISAPATGIEAPPIWEWWHQERDNKVQQDSAELHKFINTPCVTTSSPRLTWYKLLHATLFTCAWVGFFFSEQLFIFPCSPTVLNAVIDK